jgi:hypothetical protein
MTCLGNLTEKSLNSSPGISTEKSLFVSLRMDIPSLERITDPPAPASDSCIRALPCMEVEPD